MGIFNLPGFIITNIEENPHDYRISVSAAEKPSFCPRCGNRGIIAPHGGKLQLVRDIGINGTKVSLLYDRKRYKCKSCAATFLELNDNIEPKRRFTKRLVSYIEQQSLKKPFLQIAEEIGISHTIVSNIFRDYVIKQESKYKIETPRILGIDELTASRPRAVILNVEENTIIELLPSLNKATIVDFLRSLDNPSGVEVAVIDMRQTYRDAVKTVLRNADIVIDKFYVLRAANSILNNIKIDFKNTFTPAQQKQLKKDKYMLFKNSDALTLQEKLIMESWFGMFPLLKKAYDLKEDLGLVFESETAYEGKQKLQEWRQKIGNDTEPFMKLAETMENWCPEILNYFKYKVTNIHTESLNNIIRLIDSIGRGYSFEVLRAKVLFGVIHRIGIAESEPKYGNSSKVIDYGVDIPTLVKTLGENISKELPQKNR
ncbi:MAG: ISL3 family transposase [Firmicutes bacterium HGW-Firmicutes-14]|nr:MAG: ISL3 family transposase [Firmicutes bacterium HGW-Firmicutes-14]